MNPIVTLVTIDAPGTANGACCVYLNDCSILSAIPGYGDTDNTVRQVAICQALALGVSVNEILHKCDEDWEWCEVKESLRSSGQLPCASVVVGGGLDVSFPDALAAADAAEVNGCFFRYFYGDVEALDGDDLDVATDDGFEEYSIRHADASAAVFDANRQSWVVKRKGHNNPLLVKFLRFVN